MYKFISILFIYKKIKMRKSLKKKIHVFNFDTLFLTININLSIIHINKNWVLESLMRSVFISFSFSSLFKYCFRLKRGIKVDDEFSSKSTEMFWLGIFAKYFSDSESKRDSIMTAGRLPNKVLPNSFWNLFIRVFVLLDAFSKVTSCS